MKKPAQISFSLHKDDRGWVARPIAEELLRGSRLSNLHVPSLKPGSVRGNHVHCHTREYAFVLSGPCRATFMNNATGERWEVVVEKDQPRLFAIDPDIAHAFKNESHEDIFLLCVNEPLEERFTDDTIRQVLIR